MSRKRKPKTAQGNCFEAAAHWLMGRSDGNYRLVHAEVSGRGPLAGITFAHAWVESRDSGFAFDMSNGLHVVMPVEIYRALARIKDNNVKEYTFEQMCLLMVKHRHFGPWDLVTSSGK